jgi:hypothetical protein
MLEWLQSLYKNWNGESITSAAWVIVPGFSLFLHCAYRALIQCNTCSQPLRLPANHRDEHGRVGNAKPAVYIVLSGKIGVGHQESIFSESHDGKVLVAGGRNQEDIAGDGSQGADPTPIDILPIVPGGHV